MESRHPLKMKASPRPVVGVAAAGATGVVSVVSEEVDSEVVKAEAVAASVVISEVVIEGGVEVNGEEVMVSSEVAAAVVVEGAGVLLIHLLLDALPKVVRTCFLFPRHYLGASYVI